MLRATSHEYFMNLALKQAQKAFKENEVPVGCVIVSKGEVLSEAFNEKEKTQLSTKHAEIVAIEKACKARGSWRLDDCQLYVTLEPCLMCCGAILQARITEVIFGCLDPKFGGVFSLSNSLNEKKAHHRCKKITSGVLEKQCAFLLQSFFQNKRKMNKDKKIN